MYDNLLECCDKRCDAWASEVQKRLCGCLDLVAAEAIYHANCYARFLLNKGNSLSTEYAPGRPKDTGMMHWFQMLYQWLESEADAELYTLAELHDKMTEFFGRSDVYTPKRLRNCMNIMKTSYSLQRLRVVVMFYALETWQAIISMTNGILKRRKT